MLKILKNLPVVRILSSRALPWVISIILISILTRACSVMDQRGDQLKQAEEKAVIWRDDAGRSRAQVGVITTSYNDFKAFHQGVVDSLRQEIGTSKVKTVVYVDRVITDTVLVRRDGRGLITFDDKWTKIWQPDFDHLTYKIRDSISFVTYDHKYGFLNLKKKYVTEVINYNPNVQMTGLKSYEIKPKDRRVGVGILAGAGATRDGLSWFVGGGAFYRVW